MIQVPFSLQEVAGLTSTNPAVFHYTSQAVLAKVQNAAISALSK